MNLRENGRTQEDLRIMELKNKRVLVVGLGKSGMAAALFLRDKGARVTVSDSRSAVALAKDIPTLLDAGIMVETSGHGLLTFRRQDLIVVSPGVPFDTPELKQVRAFGPLGPPIIGELELASRFLQGQIVAITGSNGKTTTTSLVGKIFADAGRATLVGGNIGVPVIELIDASIRLSQKEADSSASLRNDKPGAPNDKPGARNDKPGAPNDKPDAPNDKPGAANDKPDAPNDKEVWSVLEVSSFQLETVEEFHPHIAVVLNITPDHLDRHGTFANYAAMKARITARQTAEDFLVLNGEDPPTQMVAAKTKAQVFWFSGRRPIKQGAFVHGESVLFIPREGAKAEPVLPVAEIPLRGAHNVENVLAAVCAARLAGIAAESIRTSVASFKAVEHRLEFVATVRGVEFYNDSKATNVDATKKALEAFPSGVHLILGGKDKNSDYAELGDLIRERVKIVYTIGSAAEKIERQLAGVVKIVSAGTLAIAVAKAAEDAVEGEVVVLAPACSSFDQFESYEHRGRVFKELVKGLAATAGG
jgi:UDP-N-acetylmuramoylalanine--D-glutamate ligase